MVSGMDIASVLEEYLADISPLPGDLAFILDEIKINDEKLVEAQRRIQQRDSVIQKYVKTNGAMQEHSKEQASYPKIRSDFQECLALQKEKTRLAVMGLYLITKQVNKLDSHVAILEAEGQLPPISFEPDDPGFGSSASPEPQPRPRKSMSDSSSRRMSRPDPSRDRTPAGGSHSDSRQSVSHSRASSVVPAAAATSSATQKAPISSSSGSSTLSSSGTQDAISSGSSAGAGTGSSAAVTVKGEDDGQRQNLEVNGARLSLKRNHQSPRSRPSGKEESHESFCYCKKGSVGNMIACDGDSCEIEWFHWECVGLTEDPKGSWYCPQCREKNKRRKLVEAGAS